MMNILKRTETIVAFVLLLIAGAIVVTMFVINNNDEVVIEPAANPAGESVEQLPAEAPTEPEAPTDNAVQSTS